MSSFSETLVAGRTKDFAGTMVDADGVEILITAGSNVRFKLFRRVGTVPVLDVESDAATSNGSQTGFTPGAGAYTVHIDQADTANLSPGPYSVEILLIDSADNKIKHAEFGVITVLGSPAGDVD